MSDDDICGASTTEDHPCQNRAGDNGFCWIPSHNPGDDSDNPQGRKRVPPDRATQEKIAAVIEEGGSIREACRRASVHREQVNRWMEYGAEEDAGPFQEFRDRLVRARGEGEHEYRQALLQIARENGDTATLMAMLKQRYPESWGEVNRGEQASGVVVDLGGPDEYDIDPETLEATQVE